MNLAFHEIVKRRIYSFDPPFFHVSGKCPDHVWPAQDLEGAWKLFNDLLREFQNVHEVRTHAFVLMRNHYHWLCSTHKTKDVFADRILTADGTTEILTDAPHVVEINHIQSYRNTYAYIYRNPVSAGIVQRAEEYPFSSLPYVLGRSSQRLKFYCWDNMNLIYNPAQVLQFINSAGSSLTGFKEPTRR